MVWLVVWVVLESKRVFWSTAGSRSRSRSRSHRSFFLTPFLHIKATPTPTSTTTSMSKKKGRKRRGGGRGRRGGASTPAAPSLLQQAWPDQDHVQDRVQDHVQEELELNEVPLATALPFSIVPAAAAAAAAATELPTAQVIDVSGLATGAGDFPGDLIACGGGGGVPTAASVPRELWVKKPTVFFNLVMKETNRPKMNAQQEEQRSRMLAGEGDMSLHEFGHWMSEIGLIVYKSPKYGRLELRANPEWTDKRFFREYKFTFHLCDGCALPVKTRKSCAQCKMVYYCSKDCQRTKWSQHKAYCRTVVGDCRSVVGD